MHSFRWLLVPVLAVALLAAAAVAWANPQVQLTWQLLDYIATIERHLSKQAIRQLLPMQKGDVPGTHADPGLLRALTGYLPETGVEAGIKSFVEWYREEYGKV